MNESGADVLLAWLRGSFPSGFVFADLTQREPNWAFLASSPDPVLMRIERSRVGEAVERLVREGLSPATPFAILQGGGGWLGATPADAGTVALKSRAMQQETLWLLFAEDLDVMSRAKRAQRLKGRTVLITRAKKQAGPLRSLLEQEGALVLEAPAIEIVEKPAAIAELQSELGRLEKYAWLVLTSVNTVNLLGDLLEKNSQTWRIFAGLKIACIGTATANRVRELGGSVELVPQKFQAESLAEKMLAQDIAGKSILLPRAEGSRRVLVEELERHGVTVREIQVYRAEAPEGSREELQRLLQNERIDFITFTSSSTVHHFVEMAGDLAHRLAAGPTRIASIGPITAATLREYGLPVAIESAEFTIPALVEAIASASP